MRIGIAPGPFKGTLSASQAADCIEQGFKKAIADCETVKIPMADGGEGTVRAVVDATGGKIISVKVRDPLGRNISAEYGLVGEENIGSELSEAHPSVRGRQASLRRGASMDRRKTSDAGRRPDRQPGTESPGETQERATAVMEMSAASGLTLLSPEDRNPMKTTTLGTGELILDAISRGATRIMMGIGGSATVDGGTGMAQALGIKFLDDGGKELQGTGSELLKIRRIDISGMDKRLSDVEFLVACDVNNPLLGENGAARVYGPQKGATPEMVEVLEKGLRNLADIIKRDIGKDTADTPGTGAAGGLGAGLIAFLDAKLEPGVDIVIDAVKLEERIKGCDLVITGEGKLDYQTAFGKTPAGVAKVASKLGIPLIAIGGQLGENVSSLQSCGITACFSTMTGSMSEEDIAKDAGERLINTSEQIARLINK